MPITNLRILCGIYCTYTKKPKQILEATSLKLQAAFISSIILYFNINALFIWCPVFKY